VKFEIQTKNEDGSIAFQGTANQTEATFLLNVGINYLMARGVAPMLTGDKEEGVGLAIMAEEPEQMQ
jgi:hypothetical protein